MIFHILTGYLLSKNLSSQLCQSALCNIGTF